MEYISLSQFAKRCTLGTNKPKKNETKNEKVLEEKVCLNNGIKEDFIISYNNCERRTLPKSFEAANKIMRLRKPLALRFHKFKKTSEAHQYYFSQLRLYHHHRPADLKNWEENEEKCKDAYDENENAIKYVKSKVMKYQDKVDEAQGKAQEEFDSYIADMLDPKEEQQEADCLDEGLHDPSKFMAIDLD